MSIKLSLPKDAYWMDLPLDVRFKVRPCTTPIIEFATSATLRAIGEIEQGISALRMVGHDADSLRDAIRDPDYRAGLMQFLYAQKLALAAAIEWDGDGVTTEENVVAAISEDLMRDVMLHPSIARTFVAEYTAPVRKVEAEGNA